MTEENYLKTIRAFLHDPDGEVFNDSELLNMLDTAAKTYCKDTALYRGSFSFFVNDSGVGKLPDDYIEFVASWNGEGFHVEMVSSDDMNDEYGSYLAVKGLPKYIYEDLESIGEYHLCPNPYDLQHVVFYVPESPYGILPFSGYGTPITGNGYGMPVAVRQSDHIGDASYVKSIPFDRIQDYMAVVYHAVYQAYTIDSDFQDENKARLFYTQYRGRVARVGNVLHSVPHTRSEGKFF